MTTGLVLVFIQHTPKSMPTIEKSPLPIPGYCRGARSSFRAETYGAENVRFGSETYVCFVPGAAFARALGVNPEALPWAVSPCTALRPWRGRRMWAHHAR